MIPSEKFKYQIKKANHKKVEDSPQSVIESELALINTRWTSFISRREREVSQVFSNQDAFFRQWRHLVTQTKDSLKQIEDLIRILKKQY